MPLEPREDRIVLAALLRQVVEGGLLRGVHGALGVLDDLLPVGAELLQHRPAGALGLRRSYGRVRLGHGVAVHACRLPRAGSEDLLDLLALRPPGPGRLVLGGARSGLLLLLLGRVRVHRRELPLLKDGRRLADALQASALGAAVALLRAARDCVRKAAGLAAELGKLPIPVSRLLQRACDRIRVRRIVAVVGVLAWQLCAEDTDTVGVAARADEEVNHAVECRPLLLLSRRIDLEEEPQRPGTVVTSKLIGREVLWNEPSWLAANFGGKHSPRQQALLPCIRLGFKVTYHLSIFIILVFIVVGAILLICCLTLLCNQLGTRITSSPPTSHAERGASNGK
mmetsp:Transcript_40088/g.115643  ORF Transcript_40088/g.115643 Transcript_40088/m.115643 type:complete len:340 (+) Transcript_40088:767-1786(+)